MHTSRYYDIQKIRRYQKLILRFDYSAGILLNPNSKLTLPWGNPDVITAMRCVNESKQSSGPHQLVSPFTLDMTWDALLPYECVCVSHVLSCYPVLALGMSGCYIGSKGAEQLVKHYNNLAGQILEELDLQYNYLTSEGMEHVMKIVRTSKPMLKGLDVSYNVIGDNGMEIISKELQHNKSLTTLRVVWCGLSVKVYISQLLNVTHTLQVLYMSYNNISDDGMTAINKSLTTLMVPECGLSLKGANSISKIMMVNHSLQELLMSENNIGDDGISAIAGALAALSSNHTTRKLWLMDNAITVEGTLLMVKSAVHNTVCQELEIDNKYYENDEVKKILEDRERQHESLQQLQITESIMENNNNSSNDKESVHELPGDGATVGLNEDDHSRGQEETREHHHKQASSSNQSCCLLL